MLIGCCSTWKTSARGPNIPKFTLPNSVWLPLTLGPVVAKKIKSPMMMRKLGNFMNVYAFTFTGK